MQVHPNAYFPDYDLRLQQGDHAEALVAHGLASDTHEVKSDSWAKKTGKFYVEYEQYRQGAWRPSGIAITKADRWDLVINPETKVFISVPTARLRKLAEEARKDPRNVKETRQKAAQGNGAWPPTHGALVAITDILGIHVPSTN
jgi:hypothetical protein